VKTKGEDVKIVVDHLGKQSILVKGVADQFDPTSTSSTRDRSRSPASAARQPADRRYPSSISGAIALIVT
jgi:hypothetical protein